ncbi:aminopeptidase P family protein [Nordella sp. HKS 07]|uniref:M24 family metallopeptidase n=1 Tax=Nordella sp. HKS 07 TaxID=2712222 RepID=UPI0013E16490|nr:M24 family metallopeptidase [Nordella sp. HKS 07]QIG48776.1 aminopeptidase P family protein [Nordella sp. HKS 07]
MHDLTPSRPQNRPIILPVREQSPQITEMVRGRLDSILPAAMRDAGLDMWIILCQEDDPDPIYRTMIPMDNWSPILSMLVFVDEGDRIRRYNVAGVDTKDLYERPYAGQLEEKQWPILIDLIAKRDPKTIGINIGDIAWAAGGLTYNLHRQLTERLPEKYRSRLVSAEKAGVRWASTLTDHETVLFRRVTELGQYMIGECFHAGTITPGVTTIDDLVWHYWQHARDLGLETAFRPYFRIHRDQRETSYPGNVVSPGDVIHCDVGIKYLRLNSDHQHLAYVPRPGESKVPAGLVTRLEDTLRLQDIYMSEFRHGISGNELQQTILHRARAEGVPTPKVYSHNLGLFLHQPGPLIGLPWEQENPLPRGEVRLEYNSAFVMELSTEAEVPEWGGQRLVMATEEPVLFTREGCRTLCPRQTEFYVI